MLDLPISIVVLTKNEANDIGDCLNQLLAVSYDVHVLDSGSDDDTVAIARSKNVPVYVHRFTGFGDQRNWAIDNIPHRHEWILHLDADERPTDRFVTELREIVSAPSRHCGYFVANKLMLGGQWLKYSSGYPIYQARLFRHGRLRFINYGHGQREVVEGTMGHMRAPYLHFAFSKGLKHWFEKHANYACAEAERASEETGNLSQAARTLIFGSRIEKRRAVKLLLNRAPGRATLRFWELLLLRRGIFDGRAGIDYARMIAAYELMYSVHLSLATRAAQHGSVKLNHADS